MSLDPIRLEKIVQSIKAFLDNPNAVRLNTYYYREEIQHLNKQFAGRIVITVEEPFGKDHHALCNVKKVK